MGGGLRRVGAGVGGGRFCCESARRSKNFVVVHRSVPLAVKGPNSFDASLFGSAAGVRVGGPLRLVAWCNTRSFVAEEAVGC